MVEEEKVNDDTIQFQYGSIKNGPWKIDEVLEFLSKIILILHIAEMGIGCKLYNQAIPHFFQKSSVQKNCMNTSFILCSFQELIRRYNEKKNLLNIR